MLKDQTTSVTWRKSSIMLYVSGTLQQEQMFWVRHHAQQTNYCYCLIDNLSNTSKVVMQWTPPLPLGFDLSFKDRNQTGIRQLLCTVYFSQNKQVIEHKLPIQSPHENTTITMTFRSFFGNAFMFCEQCLPTMLWMSKALQFSQDVFAGRGGGSYKPRMDFPTRGQFLRNALSPSCEQHHLLVRRRIITQASLKSRDL